VEDATVAIRDGGPPARKLSAVPLAYFLSYRTFGTWLRGDPRGWVDRQGSVPDSPYRPGSADRWERERRHLRQPPAKLDPQSRAVVTTTLRETCRRRGWTLHALNVRTNHVHAVVAAECGPEVVMGAFKACSTLALRRAGLLGAGCVLWSRHGSTRYLWNEAAVEAACEYVMERQDREPEPD
jgi:REP element-mobilizing transposase RayT